MPNYIGKKRGEEAVIGKKVDALWSYYNETISGEKFEEIVRFIEQNFPNIWGSSIDVNKKLHLDWLIRMVISHDTWIFTVDTDAYISRSPQDGKVFQTIKNLHLDKYNLVPIDNKFRLENHGIIYEDKYLIYYHQFLRRFYTSNFTIGYLLRKASKTKGISLSLAIDPLRLSTPDHLKYLIEADYWYGPLFTEEKLSQKSFVGTSVYIRDPQNKMVLDLSWPIEKTVFNITNKKDNGYKQIEIEEVVRDEQFCKTSEKYTLQKYAHMLYDPYSKCFTHFDAAVRVYTKKEHIKRLNYDWDPSFQSPEARTVERIKLFRLDGTINISFIMELLGDFFRYNEMIHEFFSGEKFSKEYEAKAAYRDIREIVSSV